MKISTRHLPEVLNRAVLGETGHRAVAARRVGAHRLHQTKFEVRVTNTIPQCTKTAVISICHTAGGIVRVELSLWVTAATAWLALL
jgi:hypothetical protein